MICECCGYLIVGYAAKNENVICQHCSQHCNDLEPCSLEAEKS